MNSSGNHHNTSSTNILSSSVMGLPLYGGPSASSNINHTSNNNNNNLAGSTFGNNQLNSSSTFMHGFLSNLNQSQNHHPLNMSQSMVFYDKQRYESEILDLKKDLRRKDTENEKQKAILQQKVELLELQLQESQEREENIKKMHETLMNALQQDNSYSFKTPRGYELTQSTHRRQLSEQRIDYETQLKDLKSQLALKDSQFKDSQLQMESLQIDNMRRVQELELDKRDLENKIKKVELEKQQFHIHKEAQNSQQNQIQDYKDLIEDKNQEMERIKQSYESQLSEVQNQKSKQSGEYEEQIQRLKTKVNQMENEVQQKFQNQLKIQQDKYIREVEDLQNQVFEQQKRSREEIMLVLCEKDEIQVKAQKLERQLDKLKNAPRPVTVHLAEENFNSSRTAKQQNQRLEEENEYLSQQMNKLKEQLKEVREDVNQYQQNERHLKKEISQRLDEIDQQRIDYQKRLNEERRKYSQLEDDFSTLKQEHDRKKNEFVSILNDKESMITDLKRDYDVSRQFINMNNMNSMMMGIPQSPIPQKETSMSASRDFHMGLNKICNARSISPNNLSNLQADNIHHNNGSSNQQSNNMFQKNQTLKRYNSGTNNSGFQQTLNIVNQNYSHRNNHQNHLPMTSQLATTQASHNNNINGAEVLQSTCQLNLKNLQISQTELKLYQSCQKMVDAASKMECLQCMGIFPTTYFYDHIVSSQSQCAQMIQQDVELLEKQGNRLLQQDDFTLCLEEESCFGSANGKQMQYDSHGNFQNTLQKMTQTARSRANKAQQMIGSSKEFVHGAATTTTQQYQSQKDKFAMTHGSADFRMLKGSNNNPNFFRENSKSKQKPLPINNMMQQRNFEQLKHEIQAAESFYRDANIPRPKPKKQKLNHLLQTTQQAVLETPSSLGKDDNDHKYTSQSSVSQNGCDDDINDENMINVKLKMKHQLSTYDQVNHQTSDQQFEDQQQQQQMMQNMFENFQEYDSQQEIMGQHHPIQDSQESDSETDSVKKENRIRQVADYETHDLGNEGNKSTYLRPSKINKSTSDLNKSQVLEKSNIKAEPQSKMFVKQINSSAKQSTAKNSKIPNSKQIYLQSRNKENGNTKNLNLQKLNTCRVPPSNIQYPLTFRHQDIKFQDNKVSAFGQQDSSKRGQNNNLPRYNGGQISTTNKQNNKPLTSKKCGNRYDTLLRQSSSANGNNNSSNSFVSPKNLMFGAPKFIGVDISGFEPQQNMGSPVEDLRQHLSDSKRLNTSSSGCLQSDVISPQNNYLCPSEQQHHLLEYERNQNELSQINPKGKLRFNQFSQMMMNNSGFLSNHNTNNQQESSTQNLLEYMQNDKLLNTHKVISKNNNQNIKIEQDYTSQDGSVENMIRGNNNNNNNTSNLDQLMMDDDCDLFGNYVVQGLSSGLASSRHIGTHELMPNLLMKQENKFATTSSQNNLVVYDSATQSTQQIQKNAKYANNEYYSNGSSTDNNVVIQSFRNGQQQLMASTQRSKIYNSTQNLLQLNKSAGTIKEKQMYVIRESCPSPLGEDELVDDLGCPFDSNTNNFNTSSIYLNNQTQLNVSQFGMQLGMMGLPSAKQPSQQQDQVVHVLPRPKFIQTLPMMRMRSITQMTVNRQM